MTTADSSAPLDGMDSQAPTLTPPTANSSPRHEHATLPPEPAAPATEPSDIPITFLLISGERKQMHFAPSMTIGRAKETFWSAWTPENSETKPPSSSFLRVLHMGKVLSDEQTLEDAKFPNMSASPVGGTIVHVSVRPFGPPADEDIVKAKKRLAFLGGGEPADGESHGRGCGCIIS
ncbi:unnamed protein product [Rhizoctonia solani]|uniref:UBL3-like ubiquitin domain-containing protein n=1 Tax=Rhizoctonia solani TaxID=456999 RepID=A0A8H3ABT0_9AGAM|nr:unnamed protein product [Rhizoctonia solani]